MPAPDLPIVQYWDKEQIPDYIAEHIATFRDLNPDLPHLVFNERSAAEFIEEHLGLRHLCAFDACAVPAMQASYFRYCAILAMGGVYSDADQQCVQPLRPFLPEPGCGRLYWAPHGVVMNGAFSFGSPRHPFLDLVVEIATANIESRFTDRVPFAVGYPIFTVLVKLHELGSFDALLARVKGRAAESLARRSCETIGDFERVTRALVGIELLGPEQAGSAIVGPFRDLPYKATDVHWGNFKGEIFRDPRD